MNRLREFGDQRALAGLLVLGVLKGVAIVGIAEALARGIVAVIDGDDLRGAIVLGAGAALLRAGVTWATRWWSTRSALGVKSELRLGVAARVLQGGTPAGTATAVGAFGLGELDETYRTVLPAAVTAATVPLVAGARILSLDWVSALIVALTLPLVPLFMVLVGRHAQQQADAAASALDRLSHHLIELARGLPVLVGLGRLEQQAEALDRIGRRQRDATLRTLRTAFLSALVLELIATISVAVVAVFVGVRLIDGSLPLTVGLIALILAPECFQPFREVGAAFHASQDGLAALRRARAIIADSARSVVRIPGGAMRFANLTVLRVPAITGLGGTFPSGTVTAITGRSGAGKSTLLGVLAGTVVPDAGTVGGVDPSRVAWVPQHPRFIGATVREELERYAADPERVPGMLDRLDLATFEHAEPARLSPGEGRRVAVARALLRVDAGARLLLLDEPTAHLDAAAAELVIDAVRAVPRAVTVVLASHDERVLALADRTLAIGTQGGARTIGMRSARASRAVTVTQPPADANAVAELAGFLRPAAWRFAAAVTIGAAASLFAVALTAVSGWLIVSASAGPPIMLLLVAIVGVRFFGIGRAALRYAERLVTHDAVLTALVALRARLWRGLAARGVASRALATSGTAVEYLIASAARVRDLAPRVVLPAAVAVVTGLAALVAVALLEPMALPVVIAVLLAALLIAPAATLLADRAAAKATARSGARMARAVLGLAEAADDLRANGVAAAELDRLASLDAQSNRAARRGAWALGLGDAIAVLTTALGAVAMLPVAAAAGTSAPIVAVLVLVPLALAEPLMGASAAAQQAPALADALRRVRELTAPVPERRGRAVGRIDALSLRGLSVRWPGASAAAFDPIDAEVRRGEWLIVEGPSGAGKSTLLAAILGYLPAASGGVFVDGVAGASLDPRGLRERVAWCPQDAHLFDSTIRGNLLLAAPDADDERLRGVLRTVGLQYPLDRRVGAAGAELSGGERQRLAVARALAADRDVVLLDEPTAHLDAATASALLADLRTALRDRIVVMVTHHADDLHPDDAVVSLGASVLSTAA